MDDIVFDEGEDMTGVPVPVGEMPEATPEATPEVTPEVAPDPTPAEEPPKVEFTEAQQAIFNKEIGKKVGQTHAEKTRADALQAQLDEINANKPKETRPEVPKQPDPFSETYQQDLQAYTEAVTAQAAFDATERQNSDNALRQQQEDQRKLQEDTNKAIGDYSERATKLGIKPEDLQRAGQALNQFNINDQVAAYILDEAVGPQITVYLANNPVLADEIAGMPPMMAVAKLASEIKPLAAGVKPEITLAPDPADLLSGKGAAEGDKGPPGVTYE